LVCTPQCGSLPVVLLPVLPVLPEVGVIAGKVMVIDPQPLNAIVKTASSPSKQMILFISPFSFVLKSAPLSCKMNLRGNCICKRPHSLGLQHKPARIEMSRLQVGQFYPIVKHAGIAPAHPDFLVGIYL